MDHRTSQNDSDLSTALQQSLTISDKPTVASLQREADLLSYNADVRTRKAASLRDQANQLNQEADTLYLRQRQQQDTAFEVSMSQSSGDEFGGRIP